MKHKKCHFCAHSAQEVDIRSSWGSGFSPVTNYSIICDHCGAAGPDRKTEEGAWKAWNKRKRVFKAE
jgi:hypothetical protein